MSIKRKILFLLLNLIILFFIACRRESPAPTPTLGEAVVTPSNGYPVPQIDLQAYPASEDDLDMPTRITPDPPQDAPEPEPGKASLSGTLYSSTQNMVIPGTQFYLTLAWGEDQRTMPPAFVGPQTERGDILSTSDSLGNFTINNIPPGNYYLVVWAPMNWVVAQISATETMPLLLEIRPDQKYTLGLVYLSWP